MGSGWKGSTFTVQKIRVIKIVFRRSLLIIAAMKQLHTEPVLIFPYDLALPFFIVSVRVRVHHCDDFSDQQILFGFDKQAVSAVVVKLAFKELFSGCKENIF